MKRRFELFCVDVSIFIVRICVNINVVHFMPVKDISVADPARIPETNFCRIPEIDFRSATTLITQTGPLTQHSTLLKLQIHVN